MRTLLGVVVCSLLGLLFFYRPAFSQQIFYVNNTDPNCGGNSPCFATIQAAVNAAHAGTITWQGPFARCFDQYEGAPGTRR